MKLAFALFNYFPYGGLERDMLALARVCGQRGHAVTIYTASWQGEHPQDLRVVELPVRAFTNHGRALAFVRRLQQQLQTAPVAALIGFNKMPGLDFYYAADVCFARKAYEERNFLYRLTPRCRHYLALEKSVFEAAAIAQILIIAKDQLAVYQRYYQTPDERLHLLPPGIRRECAMPDNYAERRAQLRVLYRLADDDYLILFVGSDFRRKGLDRALNGIAALPTQLREKIRLWVVGQDRPDAFRELARQSGLEGQVEFLGGRDDIPQLLWAADALLHPAYSEAAGLVLLEAAVAGLPVIVSKVCGYAHYIATHNTGRVLDEPVTPQTIAAALQDVMTTDSAVWRERSRQLAATADIFSLHERAAELIETLSPPIPGGRR